MQINFITSAPEDTPIKGQKGSYSGRYDARFSEKAKEAEGKTLGRLSLVYQWEN